MPTSPRITQSITDSIAVKQAILNDSELLARIQQAADIIHYQIEVHGNVLQMTYGLDEDATIATIVANRMGMVCVSRQWTQEAGQGYSAQIDCSGLRPGIYILYINVNGKVYSEKVTL